MPPPSSFFTISSVPYSRVVTQAEFNIASEQWFKYTATVPTVLGIQTSQGGTFVPRTSVFSSDGTSAPPDSPVVGGIEGNWHTLRTAGDYYIRVIKLGGGTSDFDFTFTADTRPLDVVSIATGDLIINDDADSISYNRPAIVLSSAGVTKFFVSGIPAGEFGAILPSNVSFWQDIYGFYSTNRVAVFDSNLAYIGSPACGVTGSSNVAFGTDITNSKVYLVNSSSQLWTISSTGTATNTGYTFPAGPFPDVIAVDETGTILYWANRSFPTSGIIYRLNLSTLTPLSNLHTISGFVDGLDSIAKTPNGHSGDMFVMPNGNVVTWWHVNATSSDKLIVISSAGALLYTHEYTYPTTQLDHLAYISGDSDHIMGWWYANSFNSLGRFGRITLATGVIDQDFTVPMFSAQENQYGTDKFGPSSSCTFVRLLSGSGPEPPAGTPGLFKIVPDKRTDHNGTTVAKIPNPTFKTGLMP